MQQKTNETIANDHMLTITLFQVVSSHRKSAIWNHLAFYNKLMMQGTCWEDIFS